MIVKVNASEEGFLDIDICKIVCVCKFCKTSDSNAVIELNFFDQKLYYKCNSCKKVNQMHLNKPPAPLPRSRLA